MKKFLVILIAIYNCIVLFGQSVESGRISGNVVDHDGKPIGLASVFVLDNAENQNIIAQDLTDETGHFSINSPVGERIIIISCLGYKLGKKIGIVHRDSVSDLGVLKLEINPVELQQVIVRGKPMPIKVLPEGYTMNVEGIASSSNNALDLLSRLPRISVKNNSLKVIGKEKVIVKINNVLQRVDVNQLGEVLKGYDANLISKVDVLTTPPLRYDPSGTSAMIIIHMNASFKKYSGGNIGVELMKGENYNGRYGTYGSFIFNNDKLFIDVTHSYNTHFSFTKEHSIYEDSNGKFYETNIPSRGSLNYLGGYATIQYQYNDKGHAGLNFNYGRHKTFNNFMSEEKSVDNLISSNNDFDIKKPRINATAYVEHNLSDMFKGWLEIAFYRYNENSNLLLMGKDGLSLSPIFNYRNKQNVDLNGITLSNDYSWNIMPESKLNLDFGIRGYYAKTGHDRNDMYAYAEADSVTQSDNMSMNELKAIPYMSVSWRPSKSFFLRTGAQYSFTNRTATSNNKTSFNTKYSTFLPDVILSWSPSAFTNISGIITSGSIEPKFEDINPFEWRINLFNYAKGNINLRNERVYDYKLTCTLGGSLSVTGYCIQKKNVITMTSAVKDGIIFSQSVNAMDNVSVGVRPSLFSTPTRWMDMSIEAYWGRSYSKSILPEFESETKAKEWGGNFNANFILNHQRTFTSFVNMEYTSKRKTAISVIDPTYNITAGLSLFLLDRKLNLSLAGMNLIPSAYKGVSTYPGYTITFNNRYEFPTLYFSVSYKINNLKGNLSKRKNMIGNIDDRL